ncbi:MAG: MutH/Sau3AI family endonuclease [Caryophanon sp.]|nr:MutH/Sau3AI family endonuclease [Caryophanon sp.]
MDVYEFTRQQLEDLLSAIVGKTLGQVDIKNVFDRTIKSPKITGIAGDVIEQSVLGYPPNSSKKPDIVVDGIETEVKTTGIRVPKKKDTGFMYEAKEPISVTAVSPHSIVKEEFESSSFWHKLEHLLLVYYLYDSPVTVLAADYANFPIKGYHFHEFSEEEKQMLKNDWLIVRDFIRYLQENYNDLDKQYPRISSELRQQLMLIDTAPKWPHPPRFRLKRPVVSTIVQKYFGAQLEQLSEQYTSFKALDAQLHTLTQKYKGKTVRELMEHFQIPINEKPNKGVSQQIIVNMFGGHAKTLNQIELFNKVGLIPKTVVQTKKGTRTEDMKLFTIDFNEWTSETTETDDDEIIPMTFEHSFVYNYFAQHQFLCIIFEEPSTEDTLFENTFIGFKRLLIHEDILQQQVRPVWERVRHLILNDLLEDVPERKKDGTQKVTPKTGLPSSAPNLPKAKDFNFFLKGTSSAADVKPLCINGVHMYNQQLWIKGSVVVEMLETMDYI